MLGKIKRESTFLRVRKGAAWIKTKQGIFEAWFLPKGRTFDDLKITQSIAVDGSYLYSFSWFSSCSAEDG